MAQANHLSPLVLDTLALQGLSAERQAQAQAHLDSCEECRGRLALVQQEHTRFSAEHLPRLLPPLRARMTAEAGGEFKSGSEPSTGIGARLRSWLGLGPGWRWAPAMGLALAAAVLVLVLRPVLFPKVGPEGPDVVSKGPAAFQVVARQQGHVFPLKSGGHLAPGDELRFVVEPSSSAFLLLASVDGEGKLSVYFPFGGDRSEALHGARMELPGSVVLDQAKGPERLFGFFSQEPLMLEQIRPALEQLAKQGPEAIRQVNKLELGAVSAQQVSFLLEKDLP